MGFFTIKCFLYVSEAKVLESQGFKVMKINVKKYELNSRNKKIPCIISWNNPFSNGIPQNVRTYIASDDAIYPKNDVKNFAQSLYLRAIKFNKSI